MATANNNNNNRLKRAFVTVGTTKFDELIRCLDDNAEQTVQLFTKLGFGKLVLQIGNGETEPKKLTALCGDNADSSSSGDDNKRGALSGKLLEMEYFRFAPSLDKQVATADLVISHAGSGSILESLHAHKDLLVVVNRALMANHQMEIASAMAKAGHLVWTFPEDLHQTLKQTDFTTLTPYPDADNRVFSAILDEEMGFAAAD